MRAVSSKITYPQVFIDGKLIGDSDDLQRWLESRQESQTRTAA